MRALQRCDFCDGEAVGTFEIVPSELEPTDAEQRRVLLCPDCETRLEGLLEPLLARLGVESTTTDGPNGGSAAGGTDGTSERESDASDGTDAPLRETGGSDDEGDDGEGDDGGTGSGDETSGSADETPASDDEATDPNTDETGADGGSDPVVDGDENDETAAPDDESNDSADGDTANATIDDPRPPSGYGRVMRLLRNREFPMDRTDAESLVAGAYDLEDREVDAIIEYAVRTGELDESGDRLVRP